MNISNTLLYLHLALRALSTHHKIRLANIPTLHDGITAQATPKHVLKSAPFSLEAKTTQPQIIPQLQISVLPKTKSTINTYQLEQLLQLLPLLVMTTSQLYYHRYISTKQIGKIQTRYAAQTVALPAILLV